VATGYTEHRPGWKPCVACQCTNAPCVQGCPVRIRIKDFVAAVADGDFKKALAIIKENSLLPARLWQGLPPGSPVPGNLHRRLKIQRPDQRQFQSAESKDLSLTSTKPKMPSHPWRLIRE